jgi:hypothetical protein
MYVRMCLCVCMYVRGGEEAGALTKVRLWIVYV